MFRFDLNQGWETIDEAINFFLDLVLQLHALKRMPNPPTDLYVAVEGIELSDEAREDLEVVLTHL